MIVTEDDWREAMAEIANKNELVESLSAQVAEGTDGMIRMTALHRSLMAEADRRYDELFAQVAELKAQYHELLYGVARKFLGETRHQTALRYINNAETGSVNSGCDAAKESGSKYTDSTDRMNWGD